MVKTLEPDESQVAINFQDPQIRRRGLVNYYDDDYVIWSCRFSADGNEVNCFLFCRLVLTLVFLYRLLLGGRGQFMVNLTACC